MTTSVIQQKGLPKDYFVHIKGISLYHRSGEKPLDPTTLPLIDEWHDQVAELCAARVRDNERGEWLPPWRLPRGASLSFDEVAGRVEAEGVEGNEGAD